MSLLCHEEIFDVTQFQKLSHEGKIAQDQLRRAHPINSDVGLLELNIFITH